jgi:lipid-A-disaccharide synthase
MAKSVRLFISTGEVSGDLQASLLIDALQRQAAQRGLELEILALGGDRMVAAGAKLLGYTTGIGSVGLLESVPFILPTLKVQRQAKQYLQQNPPDLVVLVDYMGPNVALCGYLPKHLPRVPAVYYIAPQEWVWRASSYNTKCIINGTKRVLAIFPEEARYFQEQGAQVTWVGHPLVDRMQYAPDRATARAALGIPDDQLTVVLMPASRQQEIRYLLPVIAQAAQQIQAQIPQVRFWIPLARETYRGAIEQAVKDYGLQATVLSDPTARQLPIGKALQKSPTMQAIAAADLAITKSGTANLEVALLDVPQVVLYKVNPITAWVLGKLLRFSIPYMSPVNLVEMKPVVPEFLQSTATPDNIAQTSLQLLLDPAKRAAMLAGYASMRQAVGAPGVCDRAAQEILALLPS